MTTIKEGTMRNRAVVTVALLVVLGLIACGGAAPEVEWTLGVSGTVSTPLALSFDPLCAVWKKMGTASEYGVSKQRREILETVRTAGFPPTIKEIRKVMT
jgi:hypothetical protein